MCGMPRFLTEHALAALEESKDTSALEKLPAGDKKQFTDLRGRKIQPFCKGYWRG